MIRHKIKSEWVAERITFAEKNITFTGKVLKTAYLYVRPMVGCFLLWENIGRNFLKIAVGNLMLHITKEVSDV